MDDATYGLMQQLPATASAPVASQFIFPGQQLQALVRLGRKLREVPDGQVADGYEEVLESLKTVDKGPVALRQPDGLMKRQLWRLQDVRDGGGFGFTIELFFLSLRRLLSISSLDEQNSVFYTGAFKVITSHWEESKQSPGTHSILLNIICDLVTPGRGTLSDFSCPESITAILLDTVGKIVQGYTGPNEHIRDGVWDIEGATLDKGIHDGAQGVEDGEPVRMDRRELQRRVLEAFSGFRYVAKFPEPDIPVFVR
ncbi:hypothetical protein H4582DRAFT_2102966 [Lactarius indigo]|nr:hypothetical protein H4582DRAFT_2102966 [Lactarius indigo]